jgi:serine protease Do
MTTRTPPAAAHLWGLTVQDLTPEMASFFQADDVQGVLVSDVQLEAAGKGVARGDVITAVDEQPVTSVGDLATRAESHRQKDPVRLSVRRAGHSLDVRFPTPD